jgi:hypothetical protein
MAKPNLSDFKILKGKKTMATSFFIDFESDSLGNKNNDFISNSSPLVKFSDSLNQDLSVSDFQPQSNGLGLGVNSDDTSKLIIEPTDNTYQFESLSLVFGNDDSGWLSSVEGYNGLLYAVLEIYKNGVQVGKTTELANGNDLADQTISAPANVEFDQVNFYYAWDIGNGIEAAPLIEVVDDLTGILAPEALPIDVLINPETINLGNVTGSNGRFAVTILSTQSFDATTIDLDSLVLSGAILGNSSAIATNPQGRLQVSSQDTNGDNLNDLTIHFRRSSVSYNTDETLVNITGNTIDNTLVVGSDTVRFV